jgi:hypothetical protein
MKILGFEDEFGEVDLAAMRQTEAFIRPLPGGLRLVVRREQLDGSYVFAVQQKIFLTRLWASLVVLRLKD